MSRGAGTSQAIELAERSDDDEHSESPQLRSDDEQSVPRQLRSSYIRWPYVAIPILLLPLQQVSAVG